MVRNYLRPSAPYFYPDVSSLVLGVGMLIVNRFEGYSRAVFILDGLLTLLLTGGLRLSIRTAYKEFLGKNQGGVRLPFFGDDKRKPVLVYGAGDTGEKILRELNDNPVLNYQVVGFVDDDPAKRGRSIHGVPVVGALNKLERILQISGAREVLIAVPSATGPQMRKIVDTCTECGVDFKTMPGLGELINGKVSVKTLRDVRYRDLLRREPVRLHSGKIAGYLKGKVVLVTGAGGSIGGELCRQILPYQPAEVILLDASESGLYRIQMELKHRAGYRPTKRCWDISRTCGPG